jgi:lysophospholipase
MRGSLTHLEGSLTSGDGTELFVRSVRPPQPLAVVGIVHGYGDHSGCYLEGMERLAGSGFEAQAFDLRGHGRSAGRRGHVDRWTDYLDDLAAFLTRLRQAARGAAFGDRQPLFLLGQSHGALLLVHAALRGLADTEGLVLTSPYLRFALTVPTWKLTVGRLCARTVPWLPIPSEIRGEMLTSDPAALDYFRQDTFRLRIATPGWFFAAQKAQAEAVARAPSFQLPVLVIQGGQDPITDPATTESFFRRLGSGDKTYRLFPAMRHETLREAGREETWDSILAWLRERTPG